MVHEYTCIVEITFYNELVPETCVYYYSIFFKYVKTNAIPWENRFVHKRVLSSMTGKLLHYTVYMEVNIQKRIQCLVSYT